MSIFFCLPSSGISFLSQSFFLLLFVRSTVPIRQLTTPNYPPTLLLTHPISLLLPLLNHLNDIIHHTRITECTRIPQTVLLATENFPQNPTHDLPRPRLGKIHHDKDLFGRSKGTDTFPYLEDEIFPRLFVVGIAGVFEGDKGSHGLTGEFVRHAHHGGLGYQGGFDEGSFDLGGGEAVTGDVDDIVDAATDPVISFVITGGAISGEL